MFLSDDFLLKDDWAKNLYHSYAKNMPIIDYHCHLDPKEIYENNNFSNLTEAWLGGDHYKWRLMRELAACLKKKSQEMLLILKNF